MPQWNRYTERLLSNLTQRLKRRRVELFVRELGLGPSDRVLDLGSENGSYLSSHYPYPHNIVLADVAEEPMKRGVARFGLGGYLVLSQDGPIPTGDNEFDAVWCNSVIEHVTVPRHELPALSTAEFHRRADEHQREFAREIARVARQYFVQTPYLHFPVEAHSWLPGVQYLSMRRHLGLARGLKKFWVKQWTPDFYLFDRKRFHAHFPDASIFHTERFCCIPKSLIAVRTS